MGSAFPMVMQDSHGQTGVRAFISWLPAHTFSTGQCYLSTDLISGLLNTFHPEYFPWQWLLYGYWSWIFRVNLQWLNQMQFFHHPCLDHLHDEYCAPQRGGPGVTGEWTACVRYLFFSPPVCCLSTCWVQSVTLVAILNHLKPKCLEGTLEKIFPHWILLQDQPGMIGIRSGLV